MTTPSERELVLSACAGRRTNSAGFVRVNCPLCPSRIGKEDHDVSLGYRPQTGGFRCFRCGVRGRMQGEGYVLPSQAAPVDRPPVAINRGDFFPLWTNDGWSAYSLSQARRYLKQRGFSRENIAEADIHVAISGKYQGRVIVPHKDESDVWWGFTSRRIVEDPTPKVLYPKNMDRDRMYNEQVLRHETDVPAMLVEGCLDAVWYLPLCVAALGKPTAAHFETLVAARRPVVVCLDGDAWEEGRALMMRLRLRGQRAGFVRLEAGADPNTVDPVWLLEQVQTAPLM